MINNESSMKEIKVVDFKWKTAVYILSYSFYRLFISGYYEFEIMIRYKAPNELFDKKIFRRFSDIEQLHEGLIHSAPGCLIPPLPSKSFWMNVYASNNQATIQLRKKQIEDYLVYIISHKHLLVSPHFQAFISEQFEQFKREHSAEKKASQSTYMGIIFKLFEVNMKTCPSHSHIEDNDEINEIEIEESKINKIQQGATAIALVIAKESKSIRQNQSRLKALIQSKEEKSSSSTALAVTFTKVQERMLQYGENIDKLLNDFFEPFCVIIKGMADIFQRKKQIEQFLYKEHQEDFITENKKAEIEQLTKVLNEMIPQLFEELQIFKKGQGKKLIDNISLFFQLKREYEKDLRSVFNQKEVSVSIKEDTMLMNINDDFV